MKSGNTENKITENKNSVKKLGEKSGKILGKVFGGLNTDSKLFKTGKFKDK